jgi:hypothetical protein
LSRLTRGTFLVGFLFAAFAAPALSQPALSCLNYESDPREEAEFEPTALPSADLLVVRDAVLLPPLQSGTIRMVVAPWTQFQGVAPARACSDRDYHGQPTPGTHGSAVLVGPDLVLTAGHLFDPPDDCAGLKFVFGYGNFTPNQWQMTCDPGGSDLCWVTIPKKDVYSCVQARWMHTLDEDWAVARLDRVVQGGTPLPILRKPAEFPPDGSPVTIVGHPNRIPMKVEHVHVTDQCHDPYCTTGHVLNGSSGSMAVDDVTGKVIGVVVDGDAVIRRDCSSNCLREWLSDPRHVKVSPAWQAAAHIPELGP